jgi:hypothetical protein
MTATMARTGLRRENSSHEHRRVPFAPSCSGKLLATSKARQALWKSNAFAYPALGSAILLRAQALRRFSGTLSGFAESRLSCWACIDGDMSDER